MVDFQLLFLAALEDVLLSTYKLWEKVFLDKRFSCGEFPELNHQVIWSTSNYKPINNKTNGWLN